MESTVRVADVIRRAENAVSVRFERPEGFSYLPGQYMFITIGTGEDRLTKHLTISSSPTEPLLEVTKGMTGHPFAERLASRIPGDMVGINGPFGDFTFTGEYRDVVFLSGGIGVTPMMSMIRFATDKGLSNRITLIYSAKTGRHVIFGPEFMEMERTNPNLSVHISLTHPDPGWTGRTGRIDRALIEELVPERKDKVFFVSGPPSMVDAMVGVLGDAGVFSSQIRQEYFPGY